MYVAGGPKRILRRIHPGNIRPLQHVVSAASVSRLNHVTEWGSGAQETVTFLNPDGLSMTQDNIRKKLNAETFPETMRKMEQNYQQYLKAAEEWVELIDQDSKSNRIFNHFWEASRPLFVQPEPSEPRLKRQDSKLIGFSAVEEKSTKAIHPDVRKALLNTSEVFQKTLLKEEKPNQQIRSDLQSFAKAAENLYKLNRLESIYIRLLGHQFKYRMNVLGPTYDLFLFTVLQNRRDLAYEMSKYAWFPVRCGLVAVIKPPVSLVLSVLPALSLSLTNSSSSSDALRLKLGGDF